MSEIRDREREDIIFDIDAENELAAERKRRIRREVVRLDEEPTRSGEEEYDEDDYEAAEEEVDDEAGEDVAVTPRSKSIWQHITTGSFFTSGAVQYYRYLIAIAVMYFISIFLTFVSLNADREYRKLENYATVLNERSILKEEERFSLSSKHAIEERLRSYGIELIDLSAKSRLIEKD